MNLKKLFLFFLIVFLFGLLTYYYPYLISTGKSVSENYRKENATVLKTLDGDTIHVKIVGNEKEEVVRLLGINTPEKNKPLYHEATNFLKALENRDVELLRDFEDKDRYNRKLRYVFLDNKLINIEIVQQGLATNFMIDGLKYKDKFVSAERFARENEIGLWKKSKSVCSGCVSLIKLEPIEDFFVIKNVCDFKCDLEEWFAKDDANHFIYLSPLEPGEEKKYMQKTEIWNDDHDRFFMRDEKGDLVVFYEY